jgi:pteridine reductase
MEIANAVVLITGAAQRVGRAVALDLAARGAHVAFSYYAAHEPWQETLAAIAQAGHPGFAMQADLTQPAQARALVQATLSRFGRIDVLINNASVWLKQPALEIDEATWEAEMALNAKAPFILSQAVAPPMMRQGGG